jgi:hypothetical protein
MAMKYQEYERRTVGNGRKAAEIEADLETIRFEMHDTLRVLEEKISPRKVVEMLLHRARRTAGGSSEFANNLGSTVRDHPVPVLLLATGAASLLLSERAAASRGAMTRLEPEAPPEQRKLSARAREIAGSVGGRAKLIGTRARTTGSELRGRMQQGFEEARVRGRHTVDEEPLLCLGIGAALGILAAAALRPTEREMRALRSRSVAQQRKAEATGAATALEEEMARAADRPEPEREAPVVTRRSVVTVEEGRLPDDREPGPPRPGSDL